MDLWLNDAWARGDHRIFEIYDWKIVDSHIVEEPINFFKVGVGRAVNEADDAASSCPKGHAYHPADYLEASLH